jgi:hypothetical protein
MREPEIERDVAESALRASIQKLRILQIRAELSELVRLGLSDPTAKEQYAGLMDEQQRLRTQMEQDPASER